MAHIVVTGANRGIGLALCQAYKARGDEVTALCRVSNDQLDALGIRVITGVDVGKDKSFQGLAETIDKPIDCLINNAGILRSDRWGAIDYNHLLEQFNVNTLGALRVTQALEGLMASSSKIGVLTSRVGSMDDNGSGNNYGYRMSKAAANMLGVNLAHDFKDRGITVLLLHPGYVQTDMVGGAGLISAQESAQGLIKLLDEKTLRDTGSFWHTDGSHLPW